MQMAKNFLFLVILIQSTLAVASPSETNQFQMSFYGADAERFRNTVVVETTREFGTHASHVMYDYSFTFVKKLGDSGYKFVFAIECQRRVLNYRSQNPTAQAPVCTFSYFTQAPQEVTSHSNMETFTSMDMTPDVSKRMIQNLSWTEYKKTGSFFFGCHDNKDSGCPKIRYTPAGAGAEALVEVSYYKP